MANYSSRIPNYLEAPNEAKLQAKLQNIGDQLQQKLEIVNIYRNESRGVVVAWYYHDIKTNVPMPREPEKPIKKKVTRKKKTTKKA